MTNYDKIAAALKEHGPMNAAQLGEHVHVEYLATYLSQMARKGLLKKAGGRGGVYALPEQKLEGGSTPPPRAAGRGKSKTRRKATKKPPAKPRAARKNAAAGNGAAFIAALTFERCLLVVKDAGHQLFTREQTLAIAELVLDHFAV